MIPQLSIQTYELNVISILFRNKFDYDDHDDDDLPF